MRSLRQSTSKGKDRYVSVYFQSLSPVSNPFLRHKMSQQDKSASYSEFFKNSDLKSFMVDLKALEHEVRSSVSDEEDFGI